MKISDFIQMLQENPKPILFCDTCAILDIMRLAYRAEDEKIADKTMSAILSLYEKVCQQEMYFVTSEIVFKEFTDNLITEDNKLVIHINSMQKHINIYDKISQQILPKDFHTCKKYLYPLNNILNNLCKKILEITIKINQDNDIKMMTFDRVSQGIFPAQKGKNSFGDCCIYETLLSICQRLKEEKIETTIGFITSNTADFGSISKMKENIKIDFLQLNIQFFNTWNHANGKF